MTQKKQRQKIPSRFRLQGTDGVRREVKLARDPEVRGLTPQQAFLEKSFITEEFIELYAYARVDQLIREKKMKPGQDVVVGWDPRDPGLKFCKAAVRGARRAGARALVLGVVPTPLVPMYMVFVGAAAGFMITASHNPKDQNGIKTFLAFQGMKLLPDNDVELSRAVLAQDYKKVREKPLAGKEANRRVAALKLFMEFHLDPENSWSGEADFKDVQLVVDPANGSLSGIAADVFRRVGFGKVIEVNALLNGDVNLNSGVADLEGLRLVTVDMIAKGGRFARHRAVQKLFQLGRKQKTKILSGKIKVCGAVFDADGDRFYRLDYHPGKDALLVLSGDETAFLQARYLTQSDPKNFKGVAYVNTVESDLNAGAAAERLGLKLQLTAVGDKWISLSVVYMTLESRLNQLAACARKLKSAAAKRSIASLKSRLQKARRDGVLDAEFFATLNREIDRAFRKLGDGSPGFPTIPFAVGSEETGHNITQGKLRDGENSVPVFFGNGVKSALNAFAASHFLLQGKSPKARLACLEKPFPPGFKLCRYVYYVDQSLFARDSALWKRVKKTILDEAKKLEYHCAVLPFREDPDMLYIKLQAPGKRGGREVCGVFVRNSGTENKIGVNLRGPKTHARRLQTVGEAVARLLLQTMKDRANRFCRMEDQILSQLAKGPQREAALGLPASDRGRLLAETLKQGLIQRSSGGFRISPLGKWYLARQAPGGR